jgi:MOSC domain-containing protein YiiM
MRRLVSVQTGTARRVRIGERNILTAYNKQAVDGAAVVMPLGLLGDEQADLSVHGGLEKAVYAYPTEHYAFWRKARLDAGVSPLDECLEFGALGENLSLQGLLESQLWAGDVLKFPGCELQVTLPREPCYKFNAAMGFSRASRLMAESGCCGFYLSVLKPGKLQAGEDFELLPGRRSVSIAQLFAAKLGKHLR